MTAAHRTADVVSVDIGQAGHPEEVDENEDVPAYGEETPRQISALPERARRSSSVLSVLSRSPSPPIEMVIQPQIKDQVLIPKDESKPARVKRKMTGTTSKHFSTKKTPRRAALRSTHSIADDTFGDRDQAAQAEVLPEQSQDTPASNVSSRTRSTKKKQPAAVSAPASPTIPHLDHEVSAHDDTHSTGSFHTPPSTQSDPTFHTAPTTRTTRRKSKSTGKTSHHFTPFARLSPSLRDRVDQIHPSPSHGRVPAGVSRVPFPSIHEPKFGVIQERLWDQPFWLLIAVTFLNKTAGRAAAPVFWQLKERFPTASQLAEADEGDLTAMIWHLGLQNQRAKRLRAMASAWVEREPVKGRRWRTLHYPEKGDGKEWKGAEVIEGDVRLCAGSLEISHIPGCGAYAYDSWRIFCRDVLRGVADDYKGLNARDEEGGEFEPEWKRVVPLDKELRACLRWMWLREGWIWNPLTGDKRRATDEEMTLAVKGQVEIDDPEEQKFAVKAAVHELSGAVDPQIDHVVVADTAEKPSLGPKKKRASRARSAKQQAADSETSPEAIVQESAEIALHPSEERPKQRRRSARQAKADDHHSMQPC